MGWSLESRPVPVESNMDELLSVKRSEEVSVAMVWKKNRHCYVHSQSVNLKYDKF